MNYFVTKQELDEQREHMFSAIAKCLSDLEKAFKKCMEDLKEMNKTVGDINRRIEALEKRGEHQKAS